LEKKNEEPKVVCGQAWSNAFIPTAARLQTTIAEAPHPPPAGPELTGFSRVLPIGSARSRGLSAVLKPELNAGLIAEVALVVVACCKGIAKAGQKIVKLLRPDGDLRGGRDVDAAADDEVERIVARGLTCDQATAGCATFIQISIEIAVGSAEQSLNKWLERLSAEFYDWTDIVGEQIHLSGDMAR
jgi:hypothetical protein